MDNAPTRILHVSDTHLGRWQYHNDQRQDDFADAFEQAIDIAIDEDVDAVIHTGDLFDDSNTHSKTLTKATRIIKKLTSHNIPFYGIVGNHERKREAQWMDLFKEMDIAHRLGKEPVEVGDEVALYGIDSVKQTSWDATDEFELLEADEDRFTLVCMHELVKPPIPGHVQYEGTRIYSAQEVLSKMPFEVDAIPLGDYHGRVRDTVDGVDFFYPGSTEKTSRDEGDNKSVDILEIEDGQLDRNRKFLDTRKFVNLPEIQVVDGMDTTDIEKEIDAYKDELEDAVVEITLVGESSASITSKQIRQTVKRHGALVVDVKDKRDFGPELPDVEDIDAEIADKESVVDDKLSDIDLDEATQKVEEIVRDLDGVTKSGVRTKARDVLEYNAPEVNNNED